MTHIFVIDSSYKGYKNIYGRNSNAWEMQWHGKESVNFYVGSSEQSGSSNNLPMDGKARIAVVAYNDTSNTLTYAVNGTASSLVSNNTTAQSIPASANDFYIGARMGSSEFFKGDMMELMMFSRQLTSAEIQSIQNYLAGKWGITGSNLQPVLVDVDTGDTITYSLKSGNNDDAGLLNINTATGAVTLKTSADYETKNSYSFTVVATDAGGLTAEKAVTVSVTNVNEAPSAGGTVTVTAAGSSNAVSILEDAAPGTAANIRLTPPTQSDPDAGDTANQIRIMSVTGGTLTQAGGTAINLGASGTLLTLSNSTGTGSLDLVFTPSSNRDTAATFSYVMVDDSGVNSTASTATINITPVNDAPSAGGAVTVTAAGSNAAVSILEDSTSTTANIRLLPPTQNDVDTGDSANQVRIISVTGGTLTQADGTSITLGASGTILTLSNSSGTGSLELVFTPDHDRDTAANFSYVMVDDNGINSTASTATIPMTGVPDAPVAYVDSKTTNEDTPFSASVPTATDVDSLPEVQETGAITYSLANKTYSFNSGSGTSNEYGVNVSSGGSGFASIQAMANAFQQHASYGSLPYTISVNTAGNGLRLTFKTVGDFSTRLLEQWGDNGVSLTNVTPVPSFTYALENSVATGKGTLVFNTNGAYTFNPGSDFNALAPGQSSTASFSYKAMDSTGLSSTPQTITITVTGVNDAPFAGNDNASAYEAGGVNNSVAGVNPVGNVLANDTDVDTSQNALWISAVRTGSVEGAGTAGTLGNPLVGSYGSLTLATDGSYTYTVDNTNSVVNALPVGGVLTDSFNYTVSDGNLTDTGVLNVTINGANDAPVLISGATSTVAENAATSTVIYASAEGFRPTSLNDLVFWFDGNDPQGTGAVTPGTLTTWVDKSGNGNSVTQTNSASRPVVTTLGSKYVVTFDGNDTLT
ncbi:MAG: tandem-95 repeat protein, partial [Methylococcaceae bacterium]